MPLDLETLLPLALIASALIATTYVALTHRSPAMTTTTAPGLAMLDQTTRTYTTTGAMLPRGPHAIYALELSPDEAVTLARMLEIAYHADAVHANRAAGRLLRAVSAMASDVLNDDRAGRRGGRS